ncbi:perforin-1-like [Pantherophis guttatus]|uniref:Perforin-1-like n=1 Tax=Pantherophis guttatus TaxID=94885 RepID=A0A6P9B7Z9_PANGU|nr:perforin-1-like [Pantherophis guttatus]XP_034267387.1 perforin-1-like [Pantherophis guttatus]XP_060546986.1 perforin-1-like [Pantherophis guttatus]
MPQLHLFFMVYLASFHFSLSFHNSECDTYLGHVCKNHVSFVPGHNYIGEGVDITTLEKKGAYVVDISKWQGPNGTCTLCRNHKMGEQLQRLPLVGVDWRQKENCQQQASNFVDELDIDVANAVAKEVKNGWEMELAEDFMTEDLGFFKAQVAFAGSHSNTAIWAYQKTREDRYSFLRNEIACEHYSLRLQTNPLLSFHFAQTIGRLPPNHDPEEYQHFINIYGTHYINRVYLGGRARYLMALKTCVMTLMGLTAENVKVCLDMETNLKHRGLWGSISFHSKCAKLWFGKSKSSFHDLHLTQHTEVVGGHKRMLFSESRDVHHLTEWIESTKRTPGLVSYSLLPLHTLLNKTDPRRNFLKQAIVSYIRRRALRRDCRQSCPKNFNSWVRKCTCMCIPNGVINDKCCGTEVGRAYLRFHVHSGSGLWGDYFSSTDAYVKFFFQNQERRTRVIGGNNNPQWSENLNFGAVTLDGNDNFVMEVWDSEVWHDELLHRCRGRLRSGLSNWHKCYLPHGHVRFYYVLTCAPTLTGSSCHDYIPLHLPTSYFNDTNPDWETSWSHKFRT